MYLWPIKAQKIFKKWLNKKQVKRLHAHAQLQMINNIKEDSGQNIRSVPKTNVLKVLMKTMRMMKSRIIKGVELPETEKKV